MAEVHFHLGELPIGNREKPDLTTGRNRRAKSAPLRRRRLFTGEMPGIDRVLQHREALSNEGVAEGRVLPPGFRVVNGKIEHAEEPH